MSRSASSPLVLLGLAVAGLVAGPGCSIDTKTTRDAPPSIASATAHDVMKTMQLKGLLAQQQALEAIYLGATPSAEADADTLSVRALAGNTLAMVYSFQGDYVAATRVFPASLDTRHGSETPLPDAASYAARDAVGFIAELAASRRIVIVNEAHHAAETRWLPLALLPRLRAQGYRYLALEALAEDGPDVARRGYVNPESGSYTNEPIYAEMVRNALRLGFHLVQYDTAMARNEAEREAAQASNIQERVFGADAGAKVLVLAGYRHASKNDEADRGGTLATRLQRMTEHEPLSVDQTALLPRAADASPTYALLWNVFQPAVPTALVARDGKPWSLTPEHYDVTVLLPATIERHHRPTWLALGGLRSAYPITSERCVSRFPCVVEARHAGDGDDAIPADRFVLRNAEHHADLYLAAGSYRLSAFDSELRPLSVVETVQIK